MAEHVEHEIEGMLPELEQMERVGLFNKKEIRQITSKRKVYEYKLKRKQKSKDDFMQYVQYETNLLSLVKKRREKTGYNFKKLEIDSAIVQRINKLFRMAIYRFPEDIKLWLSHIAFAKQRKDKSTVSRQYARMLQVHNRKPDLWICAAKWEFELNNNPDNARSLLQRGIKFNEESRKIWLEYYRLELLFAEQMRERKKILGDTREEDKEVSDAVLNGNVSKIVYVHAMKTIPDDVHFILSFLPVCQLFDFTQDQEESICQELRDRYSDKPVAWAALAERCIARMNRKKKTGDTDAEDPEMKFHQVYEEAVNTVPCDEIWSLYLKACIKLLDNKAASAVKSKRLQRALLVFEEARDAGHLTADLYIKWMDVLYSTGSPQKALEVSESAIEAHPSSSDVWYKRLSLMISCDEPIANIQEQLKQAQNLVPQKETWSFVQLVLNHTMKIDDADTSVRLLESSMIGRSELSLPAKELYLEYEYLKHGIQHARKIYSRVLQFRPVSVQFYKTYISMELAQASPKMKKIRSVYEEAVREHGSDNPDLWLDYIKLESSHFKGKPENAGKIHFRAVKALDGSFSQEFIQKYTLLQTGAY